MAAGGVSVVKLVLVACLALPNMVDGHPLQAGPCKAIPGDQNFQPDQLTGMWYVIKMPTTTHSRCMTFTINRIDDGFTAAMKKKLLSSVRKFNMEHTLSHISVDTIKYSSNSSKMRMWWPGDYQGRDADVTVVDIDPASYAVLYKCQNIFADSTTSALILSRQPTLDGAVMQKIEEELAAINIDLSDLDTMSHDHCNNPRGPSLTFPVSNSIDDEPPRSFEGLKLPYPAIDSLSDPVFGHSNGGVFREPSIDEMYGVHPASNPNSHFEGAHEVEIPEINVPEIVI